MDEREAENNENSAMKDQARLHELGSAIDEALRLAIRMAHRHFDYRPADQWIGEHVPFTDKVAEYMGLTTSIVASRLIAMRKQSKKVGPGLPKSPDGRQRAKPERIDRYT